MIYNKSKNFENTCTTHSFFIRITLIIFFSVITTTTQAVTLSFYINRADVQPPPAPIEFTTQVVNLDINVGDTVIKQFGTMVFNPGSNITPIATATVFYPEININNNVYTVGDVDVQIGPSQVVTYQRISQPPINEFSVEAGVCISCGEGPLVIDLGPQLGQSVTLTVSFLAAGPISGSTPPGPVDGDPLYLPINAHFELTATPSEDSDNDGISDFDEITLGLDPNDDDTDDDGLLDGQEDGSSCPGEYATNPLNADSDGDELVDGTECGLIMPQGDDTNLSIFIPDADSTTMTNPIDDDTDDDGLLDGYEDANANGVTDAGETDPNSLDTDSDGILDGTESGLSAPQGADTDLGIFIPDMDPTTITDPNNDDTDGDDLKDGVEDANLNGRLDAGETDPLTPEEPPTPPDLSCLDGTKIVISAAREYQKISREVKRKCGQRVSNECANTLQSQVDAFFELKMKQEVEEQVCQP